MDAEKNGERGGRGRENAIVLRVHDDWFFTLFGDLERFGAFFGIIISGTVNHSFTGVPHVVLAGWPIAAPRIWGARHLRTGGAGGEREEGEKTQLFFEFMMIGFLRCLEIWSAMVHFSA